MDLRDYPNTPKCRQNKSLLSSKKKTTLKQYSEEGSIPIESYSSESEHEYFTPKRSKNEPKWNTSAKFDEVESTPAGSPIMKKRLPTIRKKLKTTGNLVPISPITPGPGIAANNKSLFMNSCISLHVTDNEWKSASLDNTVLAVPLNVSDDESMSPELTLHPNKEYSSDGIYIESPHQTQCTETISQVSSFCEESIKVTATNTAKSKGSSWLETVCEFSEKERQLEEKSISDKQTTQLCDSTKKLKFKKGGLADQLTKLLKKESSEQAIFSHQIKLKHPCSVDLLKLQIISDHCEASLHVLECKNLSSNQEQEFYTLLLPKEVVVKHGLKLTSKFTVYFPWFEMRLECQVHPVLISATKIFAVEENELVIKTFPEDQNTPLYYESLLTALENQRTKGFVSVVASVQRIWKKSNADDKTVSWSLLLEDAFGVFMEVGIGEEALKNSNEILESGEGHRIIVHNAVVEGRVTKTQCLSLFSVIESVWKESGQGLMHVSQSQSQESAELHNVHKIQPPSFCYMLTLNTVHAQLTFVHNPEETLSQQNNLVTSSVLNRPRFDQVSTYDVLYKEPSMVTLKDIFNITGRISMVCKLVFHFQVLDNQHLEPTCSYVKLLLVDASMEAIREARMLTSSFMEDICYGAGEVLVFKDMHIKSDVLYLDCYSRIYRLQTDNVNTIANSMKLGVDVLLENYVKLKHIKTKEILCKFMIDTTPQTIVKMEGILRKVAYTCNNSMHCFHCGKDDLLNSCDRCQSCGNDMLFKGSKSPCLLLELDNYKVVVKVLRETWVELTANCKKIENLKELYGSSIGPLICYVTQNNTGVIPQLNEIVL